MEKMYRWIVCVDGVPVMTADWEVIRLCFNIKTRLPNICSTLNLMMKTIGDEFKRVVGYS